MMIGFEKKQPLTIISRATIKPLCPTPTHLQTYNLSPIDQLAEHAYQPMILFYQNTNNGNCNVSSVEKVEVIKKSLSQSLMRYYPLAGRLVLPGKTWVDCNDEGVLFIEAKIDCQLLSFKHIISEEDETLDQLFADGLVWNNSRGSTNLVGVQVTHFSCGGLGLGVSMSHIIGDFCTLRSFVNYWVGVAHYGSTNHKEVLPLNPHFIHSVSTNTSSIQPQAQDKVTINQDRPKNHVIKKFVFSNTKLGDLKNMVIATSAAIGSTPPTRVEALTSLLYKTAVAAAATTRSANSSKPSYLFMPVNIRNKFVPKLPMTTVGNFVAIMLVPPTDATETSLNRVVEEIKKQKSKLEGIQTVEDAVASFRSLQLKMGNEDLLDVARRSYWCTSLCGFSNAKGDFGWGRPMDISLPARAADRSAFVLTDTPDGDGIEAVVILEKQHMEIFQKDKELISFSQLDQI